MQDKHKTPPVAGLQLKLADIYHVLFRQKWKILAVWVLGLAATAVMHYITPVPYTSAARVLVRYVQDSKPINFTGSDPTIQSATSGADSVIITEAEILRSLDVAGDAANILGPDILNKLGGAGDTNVAAAIITQALTVSTKPKNPTLHVYFSHRDPMVVQTVLNQVLESYFQAHRIAHHVGDQQDDSLVETTDQLKGRLGETEKALRELKNEAEVTDLRDTKKLNAETMARIKEDLWAAETDLAENQAVLESITNILGTVKTETTNGPALPPPPAGKIEDYRNIRESLVTLKNRKRTLQTSMGFAAGSQRVMDVQTQIDRDEKIRAQLEKEHPGLTAYQMVSAVGESRQPDTTVANNRIVALRTKIARLKQHLEDTRAQIAKIDVVEEKIKNLERLKETQEANLATFERKRFERTTEDLLNKGKLSNIFLVQKPSPAMPDPTKRNKLVRAVFLGSLAFGLLLAFAIELFFDRSFKRPIEIETKLGLPLFLSIPETKRNGKRWLASRTPRLLSNGNGNGKLPDDSKAEPVELAPWKPNHAMEPFFEALRDRLITFFELKDINHKPKLVAVTSCAQGSGVSTVASGLAESLSETGEGNVLLVDMNIENGSAQFFHKGKLACGLDSVLDKDSNRDSAQVEKNLFVVTESTAAEEKLPRILHKRFSALIPKLHASDFDYIIFDMPPISQTSATTRVARFMDMVLMVVEAEKTESDVVKRATTMLAEAKAGNVGVVLNKSHNYVPKRLNQEL